jgi:hypothetical protein
MCNGLYLTTDQRREVTTVERTNKEENVLVTNTLAVIREVAVTERKGDH